MRLYNALRCSTEIRFVVISGNINIIQRKSGKASSVYQVPTTCRLVKTENRNCFKPAVLNSWVFLFLSDDFILSRVLAVVLEDGIHSVRVVKEGPLVVKVWCQQLNSGYNTPEEMNRY